MYRTLKVIIPFLFLVACQAQKTEKMSSSPPSFVLSSYPKAGAEQFEEYLTVLKNKRVGMVVNQTSVVDQGHLVDVLLAKGINIVKVFSPEHGFRGKADAGAKIDDQVDETTGLPLVSLYGKHRKPSAEMLDDLDIIVFDIQDVGCRFYTYISTMTYTMEACAENKLPIIVLDRPNPNGFYVGGPMLEDPLKSFVGLHNVPIVYGLSIGEYAEMVKGEQWINQAETLDLTVVYCRDYLRNMSFELPIKPSPNLPNLQSILLYPSLCLFEGTHISVGRGTEKPFQHLGHPSLNNYDYYFTPKSTEGASKPKHNNTYCFGIDLSRLSKETIASEGFTLKYLLSFYEAMQPTGNPFFIDNNFFDKLAGSSSLKQEVLEGKSLSEIASRWKRDLEGYMEIRKKYLFYQ